MAFFAFFTICLLDFAFSSAIVKLRKDVSHRKRPDGKLPAPAIIVNCGVAAHWRLRKRGDSAAGIDSWQRVVKQRYLVSPSRFETPRSALVPQAFLPVFFRGWAVAIFSTVRRLARP